MKSILMQGKERFRSLFSRNKSSCSQRRFSTDEGLWKGYAHTSSMNSGNFKDVWNDDNDISHDKITTENGISNEKPRYITD